MTAKIPEQIQISRGGGMIYYDIETDTIFESGYVDAMFFALQPMNWDRVTILGEL